MKKITRRSFMQATAAVAAVSALAACSSTSSSTTTSTSTSTSTSADTSTDTSDEPVTIHFAYNIADGDDTSIDGFYNCVAKFNETYPNIEVILDTQATSLSDDYVEKYNLLLLSGDQTDIIMNKSLEDYNVRAAAGMYVDIEAYMEADGASMDDYRLPTYASADGKIYGLPNQVSPVLIYLNKEAVEEAGMELPPMDWTWDDYAEYARKLTKEVDGSTRYGSIAPYWDDPVMYYLGVSITKEDNPLYVDENTHNFDDPTFKEWLEFKSSLSNIDGSEVTYTDYVTGSLNYQSEFFNGNSAMLVSGIFSLSAITNLEKYPHEFTTAFAVCPSFNGSEPGAEADSCGVMSININAPEANKEAAYKFLRFWSVDGLAYISQVSCSNKTDAESIIAIAEGENPDLVDTDSLTEYLNCEYRHSMVTSLIPDTNSELLAILKEEGDKYMTNAQTIDEAIAAMCSRAEVVLGY